MGLPCTITVPDLQRFILADSESSLSSIPSFYPSLPGVLLKEECLVDRMVEHGVLLKEERLVDRMVEHGVLKEECLVDRMVEHGVLLNLSDLPNPDPVS